MGDHLSLRDYDAQVGEAMAMVKARNKMTLLGMPNSICITIDLLREAVVTSSDLFNKAKVSNRLKLIYLYKSIY
nr:Tpn4 protein [Sodalis glossinidius]